MASVFLIIVYSFCLVINLMVMYSVWKNSQNNHMRTATFNVASVGAWWNFCFIFIHNHFVDQATATFFMNLSSFAWIGITLFFIYFLFAYSNMEQLGKIPKIILLTLSSLVIFFVYCQFKGRMFVHTVETDFGWIGVWLINPYSIAFVAFYSILTAVVIIWMSKMYLIEQVPIKKSMMKAFLIMTCFVYASCSFVGIFAPLLKLTYIPNISAFFGSFWSFTLAYYILKYRMLPVGPNTAAENILEIIPDGLLILDKKLSVVNGNDWAAILLGLNNKKDLMTRKIEELLPDKRVLELIRGNTKFTKQEVEFIALEGNEMKHEFLVSGRPILNGGQDVIGNVILISDNAQIKKHQQEKEKMQQQIFQTSKMASLGIMASGVAHELNNPLAGILGFSELILTNPNDVEKVTNRVNHVIKSCHKMKEIIDGLRRFGREASLEKTRVVPLEYPFKEVVVIMNKKIKDANLNLIYDLETNLPPIDINVNEFESVYQNLLANSIDAFESQTLNRERNITLAATFDKEKKQVVINYSDNAGGMLPEVIDKIYDPFFTTKETGKGTGLGMSIAYNIIQKHGGQIQVSSIWGKGTSFIITLKAADPEHLQLREIPNSKLAFEWKENLQNNKVMVVDDDEVVLAIFEEILKNKVTLKTFSDPFKAISALKEESFNLIVSDFNMPGVDGLAILKAVRTHQSEDTDVIIISGKSQSKDQLEEMKALGMKNLFSKPYSNEDMLSKIYELLLKFKTTEQVKN